MALLPGVPDMGPQPVSTAPAGGHMPVGKLSRVQHLGSIIGRRGAGMTTVAGGDPLMHSLNHYGKSPPMLGGSQMSGGSDPSVQSGAALIRGGFGGMRAHIREGGLGPGKYGKPGPSNQNYSMMNNVDTE